MRSLSRSTDAGWVVRMLARAVLWVMGTILLWSLLPSVFGWPTRVVVSGSMAPALRPGDVVVAQPLHDKTPHVGQVVVFADPTEDRDVAHRVVAVVDGQLQTRGDANPTPDSALVPLSDVHGIARLRIPLAGLPRLWLTHHDWWALGGSAVLLTALLAAAGDWRRPGTKTSAETDAENHHDDEVEPEAAPAVE